jgi:hypothetical protein
VPGFPTPDVVRPRTFAEENAWRDPLVLCTIPSGTKAPVKADARQAMNEGIRKIASEHKNAHFCDLYSLPDQLRRLAETRILRRRQTAQCPTPATPNGRSFSCRFSMNCSDSD